jgi:hypothetical protein
VASAAGKYIQLDSKMPMVQPVVVRWSETQPVSAAAVTRYHTNVLCYGASSRKCYG